jgi:phage terminase large subunit GpA-like protein
MYQKTVDHLLGRTLNFMSDTIPSEWFENNMVMPPGEAFPGPFKFDLTPYWKEPLNCGHKNSSVREVTIMKGAQLGGTWAVILPLIGYTIGQNPGNSMLLTGHSELSKTAMEKVDKMITNSGLRKYIRPNTIKAKNNKTGDTNKLKQFPGGQLIAGSVTNHNMLRQEDIMVMIVDDFDAASKSSKDAGSARALVQGRTKAYAHKKKIYYVSSPQLKGLSNIEDCFLRGDQRYWHVPCPHCHKHIKLEWNIDIEGSTESAGITWKLDDYGNVVPGSVGYICQECGGFFESRHKYDMNQNGIWIPSEPHPKEMHHQSYQISSLYAPPGMDDWDEYVKQYLNANPPEKKRVESLQQTFVNVVLGETYEPDGESIEASDIMKNIQKYPLGTIPEQLSIDQGNGKIILVTCGIDLNGKEDDARLDYEIVAWSENMTSYSIDHGSVGTFIPRESQLKKKKDRKKWSYEHGVENSVWPVFQEILQTSIPTDTGKKMKIACAGVDTGYQTQSAYQFCDSMAITVGLKGDDDEKFVDFDRDVRSFRHAKEKPNLYLVQSNTVKDELARYLALKYDERYHEKQPNCFVNFPLPADGKYLPQNFFSHFEAEHKVVDSKGKYRWIKRGDAYQNHLFDCRLYAMVAKDIFVDKLLKARKTKDPSWEKYAAMFRKRS